MSSQVCGVFEPHFEIATSETLVQCINMVVWQNKIIALGSFVSSDAGSDHQKDRIITFVLFFFGIRPVELVTTFQSFETPPIPGESLCFERGGGGKTIA